MVKVAQVQPTPARPAPGVLWLGLAVALAIALLPMLSSLMAWRTNDASLVEICSSQGTQWVTLESSADATDSDHAPGPASGHAKHCALCLFHLGHAGLPAAQLAWSLALQPFDAGPVQQAQAELPAWPLWSDAPPRAPPALA